MAIRIASAVLLHVKAVLGAQPKHSHCWNPFAYGLENGMVFMGGGFPNPDTAKEVMELQIKSGVFQKFLSTTAFHPVSACAYAYDQPSQFEVSISK